MMMTINMFIADKETWISFIIPGSIINNQMISAG